jgi:hypothetical protein
MPKLDVHHHTGARTNTAGIDAPSITLPTAIEIDAKIKSFASTLVPDL